MGKMHDIFRWAENNKCAVVAFNISNMETIQGVAAACKRLNCPAILQVSKGARAYAEPAYLTALFSAAARNATNTAQNATSNPAPKTTPNATSNTTPNARPNITPNAAPNAARFALHLDHGDSFELCRDCIDNGFDGVMIDGSALPFDENIALTRRVTDYAHTRGVWVEGELGGIFGIEDDVNRTETHYTVPSQAKEFVEKTGVDSLAISIGTAHGAHKYKSGTKPKLRMDILKQIHKLLPNTPLVLHGGSSVPYEYVKTINKYGGKIENTVEMSESQIAKTIKYGVRKINIDSDLRLGITAAIRQYLHDNPGEFDPRKYLSAARNTTETIAACKLSAYCICYDNNIYNI